MIPPVFVTLTGVSFGAEIKQRFAVAHINTYIRPGGASFTRLLTIAERGDERYSVVETPEEIDELIRKAIEPYMAAFHRLFQPVFSIQHNF